MDKKEMTRTTVLSVGGSLIAPPSGIDVAFLKKLRALVAREIRRGHRVVLVCGGGAPARAYQQAAAATRKVSPVEADWLGIQATWLNAKLVQTVFGPRLAHCAIITDPSRVIKTNKPVVVAGGWKPGRSTDYDAVLLGRQFGAKTVVNLSNIRYVYDHDPRKFPDAKPIKKMTWVEFRKQFGTKWKPGLNTPFDPIAAALAAKLKMKVVVTDGRDLGNAAAILAGKPFLGTVIG